MFASKTCSRGPRPAAATALLAVLLATAAPLPAADDSVHEYADETTAATITVATNTLVFAQERSDLAANARDYVTLAPIEINLAGTRSYFWSGYLWSTIDRRDGQPLLAPGDELVLVADGRPMPLRSDGKSLRDHGVAQPPTPVPTRKATAVLFVTDPERVAYVAKAAEVHIELLHAGVSESFILWKGRPAALRTFVERVMPAIEPRGD